ncbi:glycosyltransferase family 4 protein, partial [Candidatus Woesearchaeota archaeon]|nr:glycosyltransferase family 4 protein [Candidatus Woesearchaeota archaeon]
TFGGVEKVMQELAERQVKQGHEVHVFCCDSDKYSRIKIKEETINGVIIHRYPYWFRLSLSTFIWPSLLWKLPKYDFDILHSHVSGHLYVLITGIVSKFKNSIIDKIVSITPWELETLEKFTNKKKIITIPNGVDPILFKEISPNKFKQKHGIKGKIILFFGRLNPTKGPEILAKAGKDLVKERKDLNFVFIGPDEGKAEEVKEIIKDSPRMHYFGPIKGKENIAEMYQAADVFVMPSYREGLPLCLFEAMSCGLPIVASPVNGIPFEMKDNENGFFVNYGDIDSLKEKILKVIDNPKLSEKFSKNNKEKSKSYTWDLINKKYLEVYNENKN